VLKVWGTSSKIQYQLLFWQNNQPTPLPVFGAFRSVSTNIMTLTFLPPELLLVVPEYLPRPSLLSLRGASRDFLRLINPRIFSETTIVPLWASHLDIIQSVSTSSCTITSSITTLCIGPSRRSPHETVGEEVVQVILSEHLTRSISKLQSPKTVLYVCLPIRVVFRRNRNFAMPLTKRIGFARVMWILLGPVQ
jgi:hypothetical protein